MPEQAQETTVDPGLRRLLPAASFADAFVLELEAKAKADAISVARRIMDRAPGWVTVLMQLRNLAVTPFGLKTDGRNENREVIGSVIAFPVISQTPEEVVVGLDDRHLDFRLIVTLRPLVSGGQAAVVTTLVAPHNALGRAYLAAVAPFHRRIVPAMLNRANAA